MEKTLDQRINDAISPIINPFVVAIFLPLHGSEAILDIPFPWIVLWLVVAATVFTFYFGFIQFRGIFHSISLVKGVKEGFTTLILGFGAIIGKMSVDTIQKALTCSSIKKVKVWCKSNLGFTEYSKKIAVYSGSRNRKGIRLQLIASSIFIILALCWLFFALDMSLMMKNMPIYLLEKP